MHRIDTSTAQIDKFGTGKNGFTGGNPQTGELATALDADYFDDLQEEICNLIEAAGITLVKGTRNQLLSAIQQLPKLANQTFYTDAGSANAIIINPSPAISALVDGQTFDIACKAVNTGAVTLKVNNLAAYPVIGSAGALQGGEIGAAKGFVKVVWSASKNAFLLVAQNTTGPIPVAPATQSNHAVNLGQLGNAALRTVGVGVNQIPDMNSFASTNAVNGQSVLPNGLIIKWGEISTNSATQLVTFPAAFPNLCIFGAPTHIIESLSSYTFAQAVSRSANGISFGLYTANPGAAPVANTVTVTLGWWALGF